MRKLSTSFRPRWVRRVDRARTRLSTPLLIAAALAVVGVASGPSTWLAAAMTAVAAVLLLAGLAADVLVLVADYRHDRHDRRTRRTGRSTSADSTNARDDESGSWGAAA